jgi:hypothetical protein
MEKISTGTVFHLRLPGQLQTMFLGSTVAKAEGLKSELMHRKIDNKDIYKIMYATLFGKILE